MNMLSMIKKVSINDCKVQEIADMFMKNYSVTYNGAINPVFIQASTISSTAVVDETENSDNKVEAESKTDKPKTTRKKRETGTTTSSRSKKKKEEENKKEAKNKNDSVNSSNSNAVQEQAILQQQQINNQEVNKSTTEAISEKTVIDDGNKENITTTIPDAKETAKIVSQTNKTEENNSHETAVETERVIDELLGDNHVVDQSYERLLTIED